MDWSPLPPAEDKPARVWKIIRIMLNRISCFQRMQDHCAAYPALKHPFESMNPELNPSFVHSIPTCRGAVAAFVATVTLYAGRRTVSHAKRTLYCNSLDSGRRPRRHSDGAPLEPARDLGAERNRRAVPDRNEEPSAAEYQATGLLVECVQQSIGKKRDSVLLHGNSFSSIARFKPSAFQAVSIQLDFQA